MTIKTEKRAVPPLDMRAAVSSINAEKRTFEVMWSTGAKVLRSSWFDGPFFEELSMDPTHVRMARLSSGTAPLLADHDGRSVSETLGVIESSRIENGKGYATVRMAAEGIDPEDGRAQVNVRVILAAYMIILHPNNVFEAMGMSEQILLNASRDMDESFRNVISGAGTWAACTEAMRGLASLMRHAHDRP
jgi:hypothetical protein